MEKVLRYRAARPSGRPFYFMKEKEPPSYTPAALSRWLCQGQPPVVRSFAVVTDTEL